MTAGSFLLLAALAAGLFYGGTRVEARAIGPWYSALPLRAAGLVLQALAVLAVVAALAAMP